ncbi:energy transducer TonB [Pseudomonas fluorescens]|uniref:energy transducer TonB n=1 Tax=Pseudomonas fluorescens TaxID=294 RepID=UPI0017841DF1|nr:energy transducer TonB [Pseudomonas fluorescens]MBD8146936.1 energy transducer TonB [Pseudomonas fluorescens]MBD8175380.1 energy transducer TonB [Pseudomonas fluorescens]MBD8743836.1 energy transducer TonB [Pseudomonas fluorescens]MBD8750111.1 energy transducer TonB [Pseudomonas fluorescens]MBD8759364.1 energy transducer TonB [Pseudomonas fluorescens]
MSDILPLTIGVLPTHNHYGLRNTQALAGVSHVWQDFFARALAEQLGATPSALAATAPAPQDPAVEPGAGADLLAQILTQRECDVKDIEVAPPEPLFLPIAEFETELLPPAPVPFPDEDIIAQQRQQHFESGWVRPIVLNAGQPVAEPGPAPQPRPLHLPIAEFELDLLPPPATPFTEQDLAEQQKALDFDYHWARPLITNNLRLAA